jgi:FkbM family methyltransferase
MGSAWLTRYLRLLFPDEELVVNTRRGFRMAASPHGYMSHRIFFFGEYDAEMSSVISHHVWEGQTAWDVGAERGWFTLLFASIVGPSGKVHAFEALPMSADRLEANIKLNGFNNVRVNRVAVARERGTTWFRPPGPWYPFERNHSGVGYVAAGEQTDTIQVPTTSLDEYAESAGVKDLAFIKLDIEGSELDALVGAQSVIGRWRPILAVEYSSAAAGRTGSSIAELDRLLADYGYNRYRFLGRFVKLQTTQWDAVEADFNVYCFPR